ncbi:Selenophosphate-dependent tRNA 2-selenouridine synthase [Paenibacillus pasadenensis]|uniref:Selenophosphate-dependent tRNA 2-selenouridine synthase n=1 Tax=Paenibacillus pasadenensis TaxID=217090 RepID=A0A2N5N7B9_9BACL|nr:tRNA 2-selenouridine(34) synthase MnmH [Paenibacillus pasadenensis]PLT46256.1 Selenophosphate-dependent tRNA 2-selenouridine synthase [Paenibacillus pasadenensis]
MFQDLTVPELRDMRDRKELTIVDVRSPSEFADATIPGSVNIPFFDDAERAEIGTLYKQRGMAEAKRRGLELMSAKLPAFIAEFAALPGKIALFCWRGGGRSRTTATLLGLMDIHCYRVAGGYREYRRWVVETLETYRLDKPAYVLHGNTGTGKTAILRQLAEEGYPVLDLEGFACHRGSIFGDVGLRGSNQKTFDAELLETLLRFERAPYVIMEAESRRIGKCTMPQFLMDAKESGVPIRLELPMPARVRHIVQDYRPAEHKEACLHAFKIIKPRMHTPVAKEIQQSIGQDRFDVAAELLLEHYYDPRYEHGADRYDQERERLVRARTEQEALDGVRAALPDVQA